jgi:superkiller protein 3
VSDKASKLQVRQTNASFLHDRHIFLGLAHDKLGKPDEAELSYLAASRIKDKDKTAWQGLITLYEKQGSNKLDAYRDVTVKLGQILAEKYACYPILKVKLLSEIRTK